MMVRGTRVVLLKRRAATIFPLPGGEKVPSANRREAGEGGRTATILHYPIPLTLAHCVRSTSPRRGEGATKNSPGKMA
jgi:hypothetical protein